MAKKEYQYTSEEVGIFCLLTFFVTLIIFMIIIFATTPDIGLDQKVADDICQQLTGNQTAVAVEDYEMNGRLICELPTFDSTQNIIFRTNGGEE